MQLFFLDKKPEADFVLSAEESKHLVRVLRKSVGDRVHFTDGKGMEFIAELTDANQSGAGLRLIDQIQHEANRPRLHLAIAPTKKPDRIEWCLEKCVEVGLFSFGLMETSRTERHRIKTNRLEKIALSAMKQSGQFYSTHILESTPFDEVVKNAADYPTKLIAHCVEDEKSPLSAVRMEEDTLILIGPEGDFSPREIALAVENGFQPVSLGKTRLRTETAGLYACMAFNMAQS